MALPGPNSLDPTISGDTLASSSPGSLHYQQTSSKNEGSNNPDRKELLDPIPANLALKPDQPRLDL